MRLKQGTILIAKMDMTLRIHGARGRPCKVAAGQKFWVTTCQTSSIIKIDRVGKGTISNGYVFDLESLLQYFEVEQ